MPTKDYAHQKQKAQETQQEKPSLHLSCHRHFRTLNPRYPNHHLTPIPNPQPSLRPRKIIHTPRRRTIIRNTKPQINRRPTNHRINKKNPRRSRIRPRRQRKRANQTPRLLIRSPPSRGLQHLSIRESNARQIAIDSKDINPCIATGRIPRVGHKIEFNIVGSPAGRWTRDIFEGGDEIAFVDVVGILLGCEGEFAGGEEGA